MSNILLDMDGVFVNFVRGSQKAHKMPFEPVSSWNYFEDWGISASKFWKEIDREEYFWEALEPLPWYKEIIELVLRYDTVPVKINESTSPEGMVINMVSVNFLLYLVFAAS